MKASAFLSLICTGVILALGLWIALDARQASGDAEPDLAPHRIAHPRALDLNDFCPHLRGQGGRERLGDDGSRRENAHALQGAKRVWNECVTRHSPIRTPSRPPRK